MPTKCCWVIHGSWPANAKLPLPHHDSSIARPCCSSAQAPSSLSMHSSTRQAPRLRERVNAGVGSARRRGNHMHDHSRFQRDIDDVTGVSLSLYLSQTSWSLTHNTGSASALPVIRCCFTQHVNDSNLPPAVHSKLTRMHYRLGPSIWTSPSTLWNLSTSALVFIPVLTISKSMVLSSRGALKRVILVLFSLWICDGIVISIICSLLLLALSTSVKSSLTSLDCLLQLFVIFTLHSSVQGWNIVTLLGVVWPVFKLFAWKKFRWESPELSSVVREAVARSTALYRLIQIPIYMGFGWVDKAQCSRSARRFGAVGSSPDFSRYFSRHLASRYSSHVLVLQCRTQAHSSYVYKKNSPLRRTSRFTAQGSVTRTSTCRCASSCWAENKTLHQTTHNISGAPAVDTATSTQHAWPWCTVFRLATGMIGTVKWF